MNLFITLTILDRFRTDYDYIFVKKGALLRQGDTKLLAKVA